MNECTNCGANIDFSSQKKYVTCQYCKTQISNFTSFEKIEDLLQGCESTEAEHLKNIVISLKSKDYSGVYNSAESLIDKNPSSWVGLTYKAIAKFWLGSSDYSHIESVLRILEKAKSISKNNEFVLDAVDKISNDLVVTAVKNEHYGQELIYAIKALETAKILGRLNDESNKLINEYCNNAFKFNKKKFTKILENQGKDFDPPIDRINNLYALGNLTNKKEVYELFFLTSSIHLQKNKTKSYFTKLEKENKIVEKILDKEKNKLLKGDLFNNLTKYLDVSISSCFIATATLGSPDHIIINQLRFFRDNYLLKHTLGSYFVKFYYSHGPLLANVLKNNKVLKFFCLHLIIMPFFYSTKYLTKKIQLNCKKK